MSETERERPPGPPATAPGTADEAGTSDAADTAGHGEAPGAAGPAGPAVQEAASGTATAPSGRAAAPAASALELLTFLVRGTDGPADDRLPGPAAPAHPDRLTDGVVELRKRGELTTRPTGSDAGDRLAEMARRAAERAGRPRA
ncbi:hypothetical protein ACFXPI_08165 [Streptomyces sp. NPDC059104]|uniref:hypothetical protein n=1 Tax=Streptomyces sp. NPDC059104 TaxID=3346729 RepID=UPI0036B40D4E